MRDHPLLLILDEPTAALGAETEHALSSATPLLCAATTPMAASSGPFTFPFSHFHFSRS
jgi:ABC-type transport system involved in cytochrome bd biosynthesis fused ATPase/permease subunit